MTRKLGGPLGLDWIHLGRVSAGATDREMAVSFLVPQVHLISAPCIALLLQILEKGFSFTFQNIQVNAKRDSTNNLYMQIGHKMFFYSIIYRASVMGCHQRSRH